MEKILNYTKIALVSLSLLMTGMYLGDYLSLESLINFSIFLVVALVVVTLGGAFFNFFENPKNGVRFFIGIIALLVFYSIGYSLSNDTIEPTTSAIVKGSRHAEAGIITCYFLFVVAIAAILISSFKRIFA